MGQARTWRIPEDAPTIQAGIDAATAGDDILVSPGTYFEHDIDVGKAVWIHSRDGAASTVIDGEELDSVFDVRGVISPCTIEGFTIQNGRQIGAGTGGGAIRSLGSTLIVNDCVIQDCYGAEAAGGILGLDSFVTVDHSVFVRNEGGGGGAMTVASSDGLSTVELTIKACRFIDNIASWGPAGAVSSSFARVLIQDSLFSGNKETRFGGAALSLYIVDARIRGCTFVDNSSPSGDGSTIRLRESMTTADVERCVVAFNVGDAVRCDSPSGLVISCSNLFGNIGSNDNPGVDGGGNFSADPLFCDRQSGDYALDPDSPCLPGQHPDGADCGLVGALGEGCGSTPVQQTTWSSLKSLYR